MENDKLTEKVIGCAFIVHQILGQGYLEKVYQNAMAIELRKQGLHVEKEKPIHVYYENEVIGDFFVDLWVENQLIVELKAVRNLLIEHEVQLVNYLTATKIDIGLLINFGPSVKVKRKYRQYMPRSGQD